MKILLKLNAFAKGIVIRLKPHIYLGWIKNPAFMLSNTLSLSKWISMQKKDEILNDFYTGKRNYSKRYTLYKYIVDTYCLGNEPLTYLEFGVYGGSSFKWWCENCRNNQSKFFGFDTFEGLPENWGVYKKGEMTANIPEVNDTRVKFIKGLFQESLPKFIKENEFHSSERKIIHLDADLFSSTLFVLTTLFPLIRKGDILIFDEFNVPNHEFLAFKIFTESFYVKTRLIGAVNNYYQVAFIIE